MLKWKKAPSLKSSGEEARGFRVQWLRVQGVCSRGEDRGGNYFLSYLWGSLQYNYNIEDPMNSHYSNH